MDIDRAELRKLEKDLSDCNTNMVRLQEQMKAMQGDIEEFITRAEFAPVKMIAYGMATAVMSSVLMAILTKVIVQ